MISACTNSEQKVNEQRKSVQIALKEFPIESSSVRAIEVVNDSVVWFGGSNGKWGYTLDNGKHWKIETMDHLGQNPEFRSIARLSDGTIFLVSVQKPAAIFRSKDMGLHWDIVYEADETDAFFDALEFWDDEKGILLGDPIDGCFYIATTQDGGNTWAKVDCSVLPSAQQDEYPFAASNTNIALNGDNVWIGTGGKNGSRIYFSPDRGESWKVFPSPMISGEAMTGIYSIDFYNTDIGIIAGGNWENVKDSTKSIYSTNDGGKTWSYLPVEDGKGYISCVQYIPNSNGRELFVMSGRARGGDSFMGFFTAESDSLQLFNNSNYVSIQFASKTRAWISGKNKIGRLDLSE